MIIIAKSKKSNKRLIENNFLIAEIRKQLKEDPIVMEMCEENGFPTDIIDGIVISFDPELDVSAKTVNSEVFLNEQLKAEPNDSENWPVLMRYAVHELTHALQHMKREGMEDEEAGKDYLDREDETEAFQYQIKYDLKERGPEKVREYLDELVEYHELDEDEADDKKKELLEKVK